MKVMQTIFPLFKGVASLLEQALPKGIYIPLYRWCREIYDVHVLGRPPAAPGPLYAVAEQEAEEFVVVGPATVPAYGVDSLIAQPEVVSLSPMQEWFVRCDGSRLEFPKNGHGMDVQAVQAWLASVRTECEIVMCCSFLGRHSILEQVILESLRAEHGSRVRWMLTGSSEADLAFIESMAKKTGQVSGFICANQPLGRKWQTCIQYAYHAFDAALYTVNGSDDIIPGRLVDCIAEKHAANRVALGRKAPFLYCTNEWMVFTSVGKFSPMILKCSYKYENVFQPVGSGRFYSREYMDAVGGYLFDSSQTRTLDADGFLRGRKMGLNAEYYSLEDGPLVSVDGDWEQLNSLEYFFKSTTLSVKEFAFEGYSLLRAALPSDLLAFLCKSNSRGPKYFG